MSAGSPERGKTAWHAACSRTVIARGSLSSPSSVDAPLRVLVVAKHRETLDGLVAYLDGAGVRCLGSSTLPADVGNASAVVLFPDDFATEAVLAWIRDTERAAPKPGVVVVTRDCATFSTQARGERARVLPRPSFGWDILDAVRGFDPSG